MFLLAMLRGIYIPAPFLTARSLGIVDSSTGIYSQCIWIGK
uniref:Uncharacterized protein n=1 Tax=Rhizophora mucronata TaxID=61149 RepID=A0A2P2L5B5_RHIMU